MRHTQIWTHFAILLFWTNRLPFTTFAHPPPQAAIMSNQPTVLISGGGPAGLLAAIVLASHYDIPSTIIERSTESEEFNSRSYSIAIKEIGKSALISAGIWEAFEQLAHSRDCMHITTSEGKQITIPLEAKTHSISRPQLVECIESFAKKFQAITINRGVTVVGISQTNTIVDGADPEQLLEVKLSDGTTKTVSHVIGADGKWSAVRQSIVDFTKSFRVTTEPNWGILTKLPKLPDGWDTNAYYIYKPKTEKLPMYVLASPLPTGEVSVSIVCYPPVLDLYPFLAPPDDNNSMKDWSCEYNSSPRVNSMQSDDTCGGTVGVNERDKKVEAMLQDEFPIFYEALSEVGGLKTVRINRKSCWVESIASAGSESDNDITTTYSAMNGRVALIGDAAHGMTASTGNGCNCALESAVTLLAGLEKNSSLDRKGEQSNISVEVLSNAFIRYGKERPHSVMPKQLEAAIASRQLRGK